MKKQLTILLLVGLSCYGCHRGNRAAVRPPVKAIPTAFDEGEKLFAAGSYPEAVSAYETYLREYPNGPNGDVALLRLGIIHALPDSPVRDPHRAAAELERLVTVYPESPWRRHASYVLQLEAAARRTALELAQASADLGRVRPAAAGGQSGGSTGGAGDVDRIRADTREKDERIRKLQGEVEGLHERVRRLSAELDLLKKIDLQRRPQRPPP